jgi:hypothetical protein
MTQEKTNDIVVHQHTCQAVRHIEDVSAELDELRREVRANERHISERITKIWVRIGALTIALGFVTPEIVYKIIGLI